MTAHRFLGLNADEWRNSDGHPVSPYGPHRPLTCEEIKNGIAAMLERLDGGEEVAPLALDEDSAARLRSVWEGSS